MKPIYTLGYLAGWTLPALKIEAAHLAALVWDVRFCPRSQKPGWNKDEIARFLPNRYEWMFLLGNKNYKSDGPIELVNPAKVERRVGTILLHSPIIFLCGCPKAETCHRSTAASYFAERLGCEVIHLAAPKQTKEPA